MVAKFIRSSITIGADPELFLVNQESGLFVSAHDIVPGSKDSPVAVDKGAVQVDGTAAEFNINPAGNADDFVDNIAAVYGALEGIVHGHRKHFQLMAVPTAIYDPKYFASLPDSCKLLGCDPDFDAWDNARPNVKPDGNTVNFRTGGGHVHIGYTEKANIASQLHIDDCIALTKTLDATLYIPSLLFDEDQMRRTLYGKRGAFRPKPYGVEYRSLSNVWVSDPELQRWVFDTAQEATYAWISGAKLWEDKDIVALLNKPDPTRDEIRAHIWAMGRSGFPELPEKYMHYEDYMESWE